MKDNNNKILNNDNKHKPKKSNTKCLLAFTILFSINEIFYIILLYISNDLYKISFILNIVNFILIFCLFICNLFLIPYENIRIFLNSKIFLNTEKKLKLANLIFSALVVITSFLANFLYKFMSIFNPTNPLCPYFNFCELKKLNSNNYNFFCNYKPNKTSKYIDINSCKDISKNITDYLKNCENKFKCDLASTEIEEENKNDIKVFALIFGIILFVFWVIIMIFWILNFQNADYKMLKKKVTNRIRLFATLKPGDNYCFVLCEHNKIEKIFDFNYEDIDIIVCDKCRDYASDDSIRLDRRVKVGNEDLSIYNSSNRVNDNDAP